MCNVFTKECIQCKKPGMESISKIPGECKNINSIDSEGDGLSVCPHCIGTSRILISEDILVPWKRMSEKVSDIRKDNFEINLNNVTSGRKNTILIDENNERLKNLMKKALEIVGPDAPENCYANIILNKEK